MATHRAMRARFNVSFDGIAPEQVTIGDELEIRGKVTIRGIDTELVDITAFGRDPEFTLGEATFELVSKSVTVEVAA